MMIILPLGTLGMIVAAVAASYGADRRFWPWPRGRVRSHDASPRRLLTCARAFIRPRHARDADAPTPRPLWVGVVTAAVFCGLGVRYAAQPAPLLVSLVEATLLLLLLVIDLDQESTKISGVTPVSRSSVIIGKLVATICAGSSRAYHNRHLRPATDRGYGLPPRF